MTRDDLLDMEDRALNSNDPMELDQLCKLYQQTFDKKKRKRESA